MKILFFAHTRDATGTGEIDLPGDGLDTAGLWVRLIEMYPGLARFRESTKVARNWEYAAPGTRFAETDEIALIPPVSGG